MCPDRRKQEGGEKAADGEQFEQLHPFLLQLTWVAAAGRRPRGNVRVTGRLKGIESVELLIMLLVTRHLRIPGRRKVKACARQRSGRIRFAPGTTGACPGSKCNRLDRESNGRPVSVN